MVDHELLIDKLSRDAQPVKRPWTGGWRVFAWTAMALPKLAICTSGTKSLTGS